MRPYERDQSGSRKKALLKISPHGFGTLVFHLQGNELAGLHVTADCKNPNGTGIPTPAQQNFSYGA